MVGMARLREGATVMTVTTKGQGRRTAIEEYKLQARGGYGKINYKTNEIKGDVAGIKVVDEDEDLILIADDGIIIRIRVSDVNVMSRYASGVRVMRLSPDARVVSFARAEHDDEEEVAEVDYSTAEEEEDVAELEALEKEIEQEEATLSPDDETEE